MNQLKILGIQVNDRIKEAGRAQKLLTQYADNIRTRLGFHELDETTCSRTGFIVIELCGDNTKQKALEEDLRAIGGLTIKDMVFHL
jgi:hypothetical protein